MRVLYFMAIFLFVLVSYTRAQETQNADFELAPIASAAPQSPTFSLVSGKSCDASVVTVVYELYAKNTMVFQTCVSEGQYKIFPFSGKHPSPQQVGAMARSLACRAIFTSILLAGIPQCEVSNFPMRAAAETLLKIDVDMDKFPNSSNTIPSTDRFIEMMHWRRDVNLAKAAGYPCDSESKFQEKIVTMPNMPGLSGSDKVMTDYVADSTVKPSTESSSSSNGVVTRAELKANATQSSTADAASTSSAAQLNWGQYATLVTLALSVLVLA